jgi:hypothetical protein
MTSLFDQGNLGLGANLFQIYRKGLLPSYFTRIECLKFQNMECEHGR